ncbi:hypothetical protein BJ741DRAFT_703726 [Chytriomyces cf. hyalinus JEL632]|nr:hypothetical protein BJ741DRAFT_703726 [Chytriomyces cf. hyalinus JEL632]
MSGIIDDISSRLGINAAASSAAPVVTSGANAATTTAPAGRETSAGMVVSPTLQPASIEEPTSRPGTIATTTAAIIETTAGGKPSAPAGQTSVTKNPTSSTTVDSMPTSSATSGQQAGSQQEKSSSTLFITFGVILAIILGVIVITFIIRKCFLSESSNIRNRRLRRASTHKPALPIYSSSALGLITPNSSRPASKDVFQTIPRRSSRTSFMSHDTSSVASIGRMPPPPPVQQQVYRYSYGQQYGQYPPQQPSGLQYEAYAGAYQAPVYAMQQHDAGYGQQQQQQQHYQQQHYQQQQQQQQQHYQQ